MDDFHTSLDAKNTSRRKNTVQLYITNLLIDLAKYLASKLGRGDLANAHSARPLAQFVSELPDDVLLQIKFPIKYKKYLTRLPEVNRN